MTAEFSSRRCTAWYVPLYRSRCLLHTFHLIPKTYDWGEWCRHRHSEPASRRVKRGRGEKQKERVSRRKGGEGRVCNLKNITIYKTTEIMDYLFHTKSWKQKYRVGTFKTLIQSHIMTVSVLENERGPIISKTSVLVYMEQQMWGHNTRYHTWHISEQVKIMRI